MNTGATTPPRTEPKLVIGKEYEIPTVGFVKLEAIEGSTAVVRTRFDVRLEVEAGELREKQKPKPAPKYAEHFCVPMAPTPSPEARGATAYGKNNWGPGNPPPRTHAPQARGIVAKRSAKLKCVVFLTENPDVKRFFRIVPRHPGKRPARRKA